MGIKMNKEKSLAFVLMLDVSSSMDEVIETVKIDAKAFVRQARKGDQFAINKFGSTASWVYPEGNNPTLLNVSSDLHETKAALNYIEKISSSGLTAMGDAIDLGNKIMAASAVQTDLKAYVMLSDGMHNIGKDPITVLGGEPPIFIAALGSVSHRVFDRLIEKNPRSKFYNRPNAYQMMLMFNQIVADSNDSELILNDVEEYKTGSDYILKTFQVSAEDNAAQVNVVWSNKKYEYTAGNPRGNKINIVLIDPDDKNTDIKPEIAEDGYCIYNMENVKPGKWKVLIQHSTNENLFGTVGGIDFYTDIKSNLILPGNMDVGSPLDIKVSAMKQNEVLENVKVTACIARPAVSIDRVMEKYDKEINACMQTDSIEEECSKETALERLRLKILREEGKDILEKKISSQELMLSKDGYYELGTDDSLETSGIYNVDVKIEGTDPKTGFAFTRLRSGAVLVK